MNHESSSTLRVTREVERTPKQTVWSLCTVCMASQSPKTTADRNQKTRDYIYNMNDVTTLNAACRLYCTHNIMITCMSLAFTKSLILTSDYIQEFWTCLNHYINVQHDRSTPHYSGTAKVFIGTKRRF